MKKKLLIPIIIALLAAFLLLFPFSIDITVDAIEISLVDPDYRVTRQVNLKGSYYINIGKDFFRGSVFMPDYAERIDKWEKRGLEFFMSTAKTT